MDNLAILNMGKIPIFFYFDTSSIKEIFLKYDNVIYGFMLSKNELDWKFLFRNTF